jgi:hypothetical protein
MHKKERRNTMYNEYTIRYVSFDGTTIRENIRKIPTDEEDTYDTWNVISNLASVECPADSYIESIRLTSLLNEDEENPNTKEVRFRVWCQASYNTSLQVPKDLSGDKLIEYCEDHLGEAPLSTLHYLEDSDSIDREDECWAEYFDDED